MFFELSRANECIQLLILFRNNKLKFKRNFSSRYVGAANPLGTPSFTMLAYFVQPLEITGINRDGIFAIYRYIFHLCINYKMQI